MNRAQPKQDAEASESLCNTTFENSTLVVLAYTKLYNFIPVYILNVFTERFVRILFACWFKSYFIPENMAILFSGCWQYFLIYRVIKYIFKSSFVKTLYISTK